MNNILCIIPARGGSKGIKDKNIIDVNGKPLISYSIELANKLKDKSLVSRVIVSTDSEKIANIAKTCGAEIPFLRPLEISTDKSKSIDFILHALDFFEAKLINFDAVLLLQPTSPIRTVNEVEKAISIYNSNKSESLISCYKEEYINDLVMYKCETEYKLKPLNINHNKGVRRQDHGSIFVRNGSIYLTKADYLKETHQIISDSPLLFEMKKNDSINIDTIEDLELVRKIL